MTKYRAYTLLFLLTLFIFRPLYPLSADGIPLPAEESSSTFIEAAADSEDVSLFLSGSWKAALSASTGFGWSTGSGFDSSLSYPGIAGGLSFSQTPDITVSLLILNQYIFEAAFTDEFEDSTFMLGYRGYKDDFVQSVSVGNMGINMSERIESSDYFRIPGGGPSSFGIHTALSGPFSYHELLLRFDPQEERRKIYIGSDSVVELEREVHDYLKARFFYLPAPPTDAEFFIETEEENADLSSSDGRNFRRLPPSDYSYSPAAGLLSLDYEAPGAVLVSSVSADWTAEDTGVYPVSTTNGNMLLLYEPGVFSAFESAAAYGLDTSLPEDSWKTRVYLAPDAETAGSGIELSADILSEAGIVIIKPSAGGSSRYPLEGIITTPGSVYGTDSLPASGVIEQKLIFRIRETASAWSVDDPVAGTVRVFINGTENFGWSENGGIISFDTEPGAEDRIEITYRTKSGGDTGGDILFASGNSFNTGKGWTADLNAGLRLNLSGSYSRPGEETSAYGGIAAGISYDSGKKAAEGGSDGIAVRGNLTAGLKLLTENAAGNLLLKDMSGGSLRVALNRNTVFPGSLSKKLTTDLGLQESKRGLLLYKDYRLETGISSYYLQNYNISTLAEDMILSPDKSTAADKLNAGPYTAAAANDGRTGEVIVMDYILPETGSWTSVQIPVSAGTENPDLSACNALSFDCMTEGSLADINLYIEIGSLGEDLDGDGILDAETSEYSGGYIFNDPNSEAGTLIGGDFLKGNNGRKDSEDINGNGFLDIEKSAAAAYFEITSAPGSDWQRLNFYFTDTSGASSRARLKNAEFIRITAVNSSASEQQGRILFDDFRFEGASMSAREDAEYFAPEFSRTDEDLLPTSEKPATPLASPTIRIGSDNKVMRIAWDKKWRLYSYISPIPSAEYGSIVFYIAAPALTPSGGAPVSLSFNLLNSSSEGIRASVPLTTGTAWKKIEIIPKTGTVLIDGAASDGASVGVDPEADVLNLIELEISGADAGSLLIDEIYLADPRLHAVTGLSASIEASFSDPLLAVRNTLIVGPLTFKAAGSADLDTGTDELSDGFFQAAAESGSISLYSSLSTSLLSAPVTADIAWTSGGALAAGHRAEFPFFDSSLVFIDDFKTADTAGGSFSKTGSLQLNTKIVGGTLAGFSSVLDSNLLVRSWKSELTASAAPFSLDLAAFFLLSDMDHMFGWDNYFTGWYESTALAVDFSEAALRQRKAVLAVSPALGTLPLGVSTEINLGSEVDGDGRTLNTADIMLSLPLTFKTGIDPVAASLGYSRSGSFTYAGGSSGFGGDLSAMFIKISERRYLFNSIPFYELFNDGLPETVFNDCSGASIDQGNLENTFTAAVSRNYSSCLTDLLLPYSVEFSIGREIIKDFNEFEDELSLNLVWRSAALNLFGAAGVYPLFGFYFSDELNWAVETSVSDPFSPSAVQEYLITGGCSFFGHTDNIFSVDGSLYLPVNDEDKTSSLKTGLMYVWNQYPGELIRIPLLPQEEEGFQLITHEEKLSLNFAEVFSSEIRHTTSLILPQRLTLSAFGLAGFELNTLSDNKTALFGLSFGISGSIIY